MKSLIGISFVVLISSCTPTCAPKGADSAEPAVNAAELGHQKLVMDVKIKPTDFDKILREAIYFSSNLEREALKLILNDNSMQKLSLFSVLSYIVEINTGAKKTTPYGLDCGTFEVNKEKKTIKIFKSCVRPIVEIAQIQILQESMLYEVEFVIKEWADVVGLAASLTGDNTRCLIKIKDKKLQQLSCENWSYQTSEDQISSTIIKAKYFLFQREAQKQFVIRGGFFRELVENKKIDIVVPLEGIIKIFEKEIKVRDDFADKINEKINETSQEASQDIAPASPPESNSRSHRGR